MPKPTPSPFYKRRSLIILGLIITLVAVGFLGVVIRRHENNKAIAADRARFELAAKDVQTIADSIKASLPPEQSSINKDCVYQGREFAPKPVVCEIVYKTSYGVNDASEADLILAKHKSILRSDVSILSGGDEKDEILNAPTAQKSSTVSELYKDKASNLNCTQTYELYFSHSPPSYNSDIISKQGDLTLLSTLDCGGQAKSAHYPVVN